MEKYVELVNDLYKEPIELVIMGTFTKENTIESKTGKPALKGEKKVAKKNISSSKSPELESLLGCFETGMC